MLTQLAPDLYAWSEPHGTPEWRYQWYSYAVRIADVGVLALVDPLAASEDEARALEELGPPTHVLLTCNWHLRDAEACRRRWGASILVHEAGFSDAEAPMDGSFQDGDEFWGTVKAIHMPGLSWPEETGFLIASGGGVLIVGDAFCGRRADIGVPEGAVGRYTAITIPSAKQHQAQQSAQHLLTLPFDSICFGHGSPILHNAKAAIERFITHDALLTPATTRPEVLPG